MQSIANISNYHDRVYYMYKDRSGCSNQAVKELSGNLYKYTRSVEDKLVELITEEQFKSRLSSYSEYVDHLMRVKNVRRDLRFEAKF